MSSLRDRVAALSAKLSGSKRGRGVAAPRGAKRAKATAADPSQRYAAQPLSAPVVARWRSYFRPLAPGTPKVRVGETTGWRGVAKLAARSAKGRVLLGLFAPGSHDVVESARASPAHAPSLNVAIAAVETALAGERIYATGDPEGNGAVTYVGFAAQTAPAAVCVSLVFNARADDAAASAAATRIAARLSEKPWLHSLHAHLNPVSPHDNAIYGRGGAETWRQLAPAAETTPPGFASARSGCVRETPFGAPLYFAPPCFRQANLPQFFRIVDALRAHVPNKSRVVELYGGVATIGAHLVAKARYVRCSDENPWNAACVALTRRDLPDALAQKLTYETAPAAAVARRGGLDDCDVVIVDPPRKGLCDDVRAALLRRGQTPRRLVYVSCGFDALKRDIDELLAARWTLVHVEGHVLFPGADHVETLAVLDEEGRGGRGKRKK